MGRYFEWTKTVPIITRVINERTSPGGTYLPRNSIVQALLEDRGDRLFVQQCHRRYKREGGTDSLKQFAGNMVDWFSAWWTRRYFGLRNAFERRRIDGTWAYRVATQKSTLDLDGLNRITIEATLNVPPTLTSPEALAKRAIDGSRRSESDFTMARKRKTSGQTLKGIRNFLKEIDRLIEDLEASDPEAVEASRALLHHSIDHLGDHGLAAMLVSLKVLTRFVAKEFYQDSPSSPKQRRTKRQR